MTNNEDDYSSAKEWTDEKYITWKANKTTRIYLYDGEMPYRGVYLGDYYFKGKQNNYTVFNTYEICAIEISGKDVLRKRNLYDQPITSHFERYKVC
jgi:hypothetical protein